MSYEKYGFKKVNGKLVPLGKDFTVGDHVRVITPPFNDGRTGTITAKGVATNLLGAVTAVNYLVTYDAFMHPILSGVWTAADLELT